MSGLYECDYFSSVKTYYFIRSMQENWLFILWKSPWWNGLNATLPTRVKRVENPTITFTFRLIPLSNVGAPIPFMRKCSRNKVLWIKVCFFSLFL